MRALVTGAAGFVGSHLVDRLIGDGFDVVGIDNFVTGRRANIAHLEHEPRFELLEQDAWLPVINLGSLDRILHLASPASPPAYLAHPVATLRANGEGTRVMLDAARATGARFLLASSSEVYGDPAVHPQPETYAGNVQSVGPRSMYQEAKRYAEALTTAYSRALGVDVRIARIFNTYGPRMAPTDGRVVSTLASQALEGRPMTVHGDGSQTRSFQYVDDLVEGLRRLMEADYESPVNLGMPIESSVLELAQLILGATGSSSDIQLVPGPAGDPQRRCPDISLARRLLGWQPITTLAEGLRPTLAALREELQPKPAAAGGPATGT